MSQVPCRATPRWSVAGQVALSPELMAGAPPLRAGGLVGPGGVKTRASRRGFSRVLSEPVGMPVQPVGSLTKLKPLEVTVPEQSGLVPEPPIVLSAIKTLFKVAEDPELFNATNKPPPASGPPLALSRLAVFSAIVRLVRVATMEASPPQPPQESEI